MSKRSGAWIWYELMTDDPAGAGAFYENVLGWRLGPQMPGALEYRLLSNPAGGATHPVAGGVLGMSQDMKAQGARPGWLGYIHTPDAAATLTLATAAGARVHMPLTHLDEVGDFALLADPQGAFFYIMTPQSTGESTVFARGMTGVCGWNELTTSDPQGAIGFYTTLFGWDLPPPMDMGSFGFYHFIARGDEMMGAITGLPPADPSSPVPPHWNFYFRVDSITEAAAQVEAGGGTVLLSPHQVPDGDWIIHARDPQGAHFCLVGK